MQAEDIYQWVELGNLPPSLTLPSSPEEVARNLFFPRTCTRQKFVFGGDEEVEVPGEQKGTHLMLKELSSGDGKRVLYWEGSSVTKKYLTKHSRMNSTQVKVFQAAGKMSDLREPLGKCKFFFSVQTLKHEGPDKRGDYQDNWEGNTIMLRSLDFIPKIRFQSGKKHGQAFGLQR